MLNAMPALGLASAEAQLRQLSEQQAAITRALAAMAEGHSNEAIARRLYLAPKTVEANIHRVPQKLDITESPDSNRRVLAVLTYLRSA